MKTVQRIPWKEDKNMVRRIYYTDHDERYANLSSMERKQYPDEVYVYGWGIIKREKNFSEMTKEDFNRYREYVRLAAKDIPLFRGMKD